MAFDGETFAVNCVEFPTPIVALVLFKVIPVTPCLTVTVQVADFLLPSVVTQVIFAVPGGFCRTKGSLG